MGAGGGGHGGDLGDGLAQRAGHVDPGPLTLGAHATAPASETRRALQLGQQGRPLVERAGAGHRVTAPVDLSSSSSRASSRRR